MFKETKMAIRNFFQRKNRYLTVTTITVTGNVSQVTLGPQTNLVITDLRDAFHRLANTRNDYAVHTIIHKVPYK